MSDSADITDANVPRMRYIADALDEKATAAETFKTTLMATGNRLAMGFETWAPAQLAIELHDELGATATVLRTRARMAELADRGESFEHLLFAFDQQVGNLRDGLDDGVGASGGDADRQDQLERIAFPNGVPTQSPYDRRSPEQWESEVLTGPILAAASPHEAYEYWKTLDDDQKIAAFDHAAESVEKHYRRVGGGVPVAVRYSTEGAEELRNILGDATARTEGDDGHNLVSDAPYWIGKAAGSWIRQGFDGPPWEGPQVDGLYVQDVPLWVIAMWLGPDADVGAAGAAVDELPTLPARDLTPTPAPQPYDRYSGHGERVVPADPILPLAELLAYDLDPVSVAEEAASGVPETPGEVIFIGVRLLATAYAVAEWDYDPNVKVDPDNTYTDLSGAAVWPPSLGQGG